MAQELSYDEMLTRLEPLQMYVGLKVQHIKSSNWYRITGVRFKEDDMTIWFDYETCHRKPIGFFRPIGELLDGRFAFK